MPLTFSTLDDFYAHGHDTVIDVRSPSEFAEDHVPGAISLPVLDDEERARVGTIYKQESPFLARKLGAALVFRNAAGHLERSLSHHEGGWRPLVYCWRGGQRSGSFAWMLKEIGWRADTVEGGYRTYRRLVNGYLYDSPLPHSFVLIDGNTGTAKTDLLHVLARRGWQVLDLEGAANHRGSLLGGMGGQPSQKAFETTLARRLTEMDPARVVLVEAESSKIGERIIPPSVWAVMKGAARVEIEAPMAARVGYLVEAYDDVLSDGPKLEQLLWHLRTVRGHEVVDGWIAHIASGDKAALTRDLMAQHYDPAYAKSRRAIGGEPVARVTAEALSPAGIEAAATQLEAVLKDLPGA
ncbi:tRNA 2-selenouridine(34) synthase MnmH [Marinibacterium profundimaris]|uniref:tRNA 2-selenouridine synthase n=1 Tax=Marinibacterium profundimaris TaxID=1679460 RepID=A0A225NF58_9RHOB|nr:tRNA 2-selenouridine(34) synthase MnmH [Marinibacterium profundimaris]OWU71663.1 tRNA 2-selenouridine synthase [Marinibacterium profundimaris]